MNAPLHASASEFHSRFDHDEVLCQALDELWQEHSRLMSPAGFARYIEGAATLYKLGKGQRPVLSYLHTMPQVVRECGEDIIGDCVAAAMKLASLVSGDVIAELFYCLPGVTIKLGDAQLLRAYLQFIHQFASTTARGLRPMLSNMDELLSKLTLSGLQRWAKFGTHSYRRDYPRLTEYFSLNSADALSVLQNERRGVLLVAAQRKIGFYLRALWGRDFHLRPTGTDLVDQRPYIEQFRLHLPDALDKQAGLPAVDVYRATAAHMAAHQCYGVAAFSPDTLSPAQRFFIGFIEDARIEHRAVGDFPGLKNHWQALLAATDLSRLEDQTLQQLVSLAIALMDADQPFQVPELNKLCEQFHQHMRTDPEDHSISVHLGLALYDHYANRREVPSLRSLEQLPINYRDDNRALWVEAEYDAGLAAGESALEPEQVLRDVGLMEFINEVDCELAGDDAQEIWTCTSELYPYEDDLQNTESYNQMWGKAKLSPPFHYPEWDYQVQLEKPAWTTLQEQARVPGDPELIRTILENHKPIVQRIRYIIDQLAPAGVQRIRNLEDGDEIDLNAAIDAMVALRSKQQPSQRITLRQSMKRRDLAVIVLMDLSESTNEQIRDSEKTVLDVTREAATLVATAMDGIGDNYALHGFSSDGRHDVHYFVFKDFTQRFDDEARARLAGMSGGYSTRMGAAIRHADYHLRRQSEQRKLLLIVTDGEPADIDERDPQYLRHDTRKAVEEAYRHGVLSYCLTLDPSADQYVSRIFGENNYTILDSVEKLPEKLPQLFASLTV